jgi:hypothetical protein
MQDGFAAVTLDLHGHQSSRAWLGTMAWAAHLRSAHAIRETAVAFNMTRRMENECGYRDSRVCILFIGLSLVYITEIPTRLGGSPAGERPVAGPDWALAGVSDLWRHV